MPDEADQPKYKLTDVGAPRGMVTAVHAESLLPGSWELLQNVDLSTDGLLEKRRGKIKPSSLTGTLGSNRVRGLAEFKKAGAVTNILAMAGTTLSKWDGISNWSTIGSPFTTGLETFFIAGNNKLFILNGTDPVYSWDGTTLLNEESGSVADDPPRGTFGCVHQGRMIISGETANPDRVYFSNALSFGTGQWDRALDFFTFRQGSGEFVKAVIGMRNFQLYVFCDHSIHACDTGAADAALWSLRVIDPFIGCGATKSVVPVGDDVLFMDQFGHIRSLNRTLAVNFPVKIAGVEDAGQQTQTFPLSHPISPLIESLNKNALSTSEAIYHNGLYLISVPSVNATFPDTILAYDVERGTWAVWTSSSSGGMNIAKMVTSIVGDEKTRTLYGGSGSATGILWQMDVGYEDDAVGIEYEARTRAFNFEQPENDKLFTELEVRCIAVNDGDLEVDAQVDYQGYTNIGSMALQGAGLMFPFIFPISFGDSGVSKGKFHLTEFGLGRCIQFKFRNAELGVNVRLKDLTVFAIPENYNYE